MLSHDDWMLTMRLPPLRSPCLVSPDTPGGICSFCMPSKGRHVAFGVPLQARRVPALSYWQRLLPAAAEQATGLCCCG